MGINAIVGQSGGPTCVINSSLAGVFSACRKHGVQHVYGMPPRAFRGCSKTT